MEWGIGFFVVCAEGRRARRRQLFSGFVALARGAYSLGDDLGESLAEGYDIDLRRVHAFSKSKEEDARSGLSERCSLSGQLFL